MCGADGDWETFCRALAGSSPRVRSRPHHRRLGLRHHGIISACAEQTDPFPSAVLAHQDHLRVCGADFLSHSGDGVHKGIISACAEQTFQSRTRFWKSCGSSPRVRSRRNVLTCFNDAAGIISACAEQTRADVPDRPRTWDHLRVCGADGKPLPESLRSVGSSPRVRSRRVTTGVVGMIVRIISACAEQTAALEH